MEGAYFLPRAQDSQHAVETTPAQYVYTAYAACEASDNVELQSCQALSLFPLTPKQDLSVKNEVAEFSTAVWVFIVASWNLHSLLLLFAHLRLGLALDSAMCRCRAWLDIYGDHGAACPWAGLLRAHSIPLERCQNFAVRLA